MEGVNDGNIKLTPIMQIYTPYCGDYWLAYIYHVIFGQMQKGVLVSMFALH